MELQASYFPEPTKVVAWQQPSTEWQQPSADWQQQSAEWQQPTTEWQPAAPPVPTTQTVGTDGILQQLPHSQCRCKNSNCNSCYPIPNPEAVAENAYDDTLQSTPVTAFDTPCCPNPPPCNEEVLWRAQFKGCPPSYIDNPKAVCEVNPYGDRYWVTDLNPLILERSIISGAKWNPYQHMNARQMFAQFLWADMKKIGSNDSYTKPIGNLNDSYCIRQATSGSPKYTRF